MSNPLWNPRTTPNNSERLETTPNDSKQLRTPPNNSKHDSRVGVKLYLDLYTTKLPDTPGRIHCGIDGSKQGFAGGCSM